VAAAATHAAVTTAVRMPCHGGESDIAVVTGPRPVASLRASRRDRRAAPLCVTGGSRKPAPRSPRGTAPAWLWPCPRDPGARGCGMFAMVSLVASVSTGILAAAGGPAWPRAAGAWPCS